MSAATRARALERKVAKLRGRATHLFRAPGEPDLELHEDVVIDGFMALMAGRPSGLSDRARSHLARADERPRSDVEAALIEDARGRWPSVDPPTPEEADMARPTSSEQRARESIAAKVAAFDAHPDEYEGSPAIDEPAAPGDEPTVRDSIASKVADLEARLAAEGGAHDPDE